MPKKLEKKPVKKAVVKVEEKVVEEKIVKKKVKTTNEPVKYRVGSDEFGRGGRIITGLVQGDKIVTPEGVTYAYKK